MKPRVRAAFAGSRAAFAVSAGVLAAVGILAAVAGVTPGADPARRAGRPEQTASLAEASAADDAGIQAFLDVARVLKSPRCQNCHPAGDSPLQTDAGIPHAMLVTRGPDGRGVTAMKCSNCHGRQNAPGPHRPPGAPNWHLPPPATPMVFEGRSPGEICTLMKDPAQNGGKSLEQLVEHLTADSLVLWGWNPGAGRTLPPLSQPEFAARVETWAEGGFPCPEEAAERGMTSAPSAGEARIHDEGARREGALPDEPEGGRG